jgi:hypothetical protein
MGGDRSMAVLGVYASNDQLIMSVQRPVRKRPTDAAKSTRADDTSVHAVRDLRTSKVSQRPKRRIAADSGAKREFEPT